MSTRPTLTRRGRLVVHGTLVIAVLAALLAALVAAGPSVVATSGAGDPLEVRTVTVQPGQTLWEIAADSGASGDLRDTVYAIEQLNHLDGPALRIGQTVHVPVPVD